MAKKQAQKRKLTRKEAKESIPAIKEFNRLAAIFLKVFSQNVEQKEKSLNSISVMIYDFKPMPKWQNRINIQNIDIKSSLSYSSGFRSISTQSDKWEDDYRQKRKGVIL